MTEAIRLFIGIGALTWVVEVVILNHPYRKKLRNSHIMARIGVGVVFLSLAYGVYESNLMNLPYGPRLIYTAIGIGWANIGTLWAIHDDRKYGPNRNVPPGL